MFIATFVNGSTLSFCVLQLTSETNKRYCIANTRQYVVVILSSVTFYRVVSDNPSLARRFTYSLLFQRDRKRVSLVLISRVVKVHGRNIGLRSAH